MNLHLRRFEPTDADYETVVAIHNAIWPEYIEDVAQWRHWDEQLPEHCLRERWIAERDGAVVGFGQFFQTPWMYHPRKFYIYVDIYPDHQSQGHGRQIYDFLFERVTRHDPLALRTDSREDRPASLHFIQSRGYLEEMRFWESRLDLASFDPQPWAGHDARVRAQGITFVTLRELLDSGMDFKQRHYELIIELVRDVPQPDNFTPLSLDEWAKGVFDDPNLLPEAYLFALHNGEFVGVSQLWRYNGDPAVLNTGLTATRRDYRRMGIALALKLRAIAFARAQGIREIRTGNETNNRPMLSINEALGFVKQPVWISFVKTIKTE